MRIEPRLFASPLAHPSQPSPDDDLPARMRLEPRPARSVRAASRSDGRGHRLGHAAAYLTAVVVGLSVGPAVILLASRTEFLHWANLVLNLVSGT